MTIPHPLSLPPERPDDDSSRYRAGHTHGPGCDMVVVMPHLDPTLQLPKRRGEHSWIAMLVLPVDAGDLLAGSAALNLAGGVIDMRVRCSTCEVIADGSPEIITTPCPGDPKGLYMPTRAEYREWTETEREIWHAAMEDSRGND